MCGIAGFVGGGDEADLRKMMSALRHRGPDGEGAFVDDEARVFLGHRRLAVIDQASGAQPMWNEDETICIVFNGMIYNHVDLRRQLEARGHLFRSDHSDTEVLIHGYEEWGKELLERLNGMFAFAIYDRRRRRMFIARDRFGEKPLFFGRRGHDFAFASEITSILQHPSFKGSSSDKRAAQKFFAYGFLPAPNTHIEGISKLPSGHYLEFALADASAQPKSYWRFSVVPGEPPVGNERDWIDELDALIHRSVAGRLDSDVPLGVFLSGGVDSGVVLSHAAELAGSRKVDAFTIGFNEPSFDETIFAEQMARHCGADHHVRTCALDDVRDLIFGLKAIIDEPLGDGSLLPTYLLCEFARRRVTVALSGDGADELFAGYDPFKALEIAKLYTRIVPKPVHHAVAAVATRLPPSDRNMSFDFKLNRGLRGLGLKSALWNPVWLAPAGQDELQRLFGCKVDVEDLYSEAIRAWEGAESRDPVDRTLEFYTNFYLPDDILVKTDRASMRSGLEVRAPFLDYDVVEFARRLPATAKLRRGVTKWILKRSAEKRIPSSLVNRKKKGFGIPIARWLREMPAASLRYPPYVDRRELDAMWAQHRTRIRDRRGVLWCAFASALA